MRSQKWLTTASVSGIVVGPAVVRRWGSTKGRTTWVSSAHGRRCGGGTTSIRCRRSSTCCEHEGGAWRWTRSQPELRFLVQSARNRRFKLELGVNDVTFRDTGPLRLVIFVNEHELDRIVYDSPGEKSYEKAVPANMLRENAENRVLIRVLNPWDTNDPKVKLGFIFHEAGFK